MSIASRNAIQLFTYLKELSKLRTTHVRDITNQKNSQVVWFSDIPEVKHCNCIAWNLWAHDSDDRNDVWIRVRKPNLKSPPEVSDSLEQWVDEEQLANSSLEEPSLFDNITVVLEKDLESGEELTSSLELVDHPLISDAWRKYLEDDWLPWAREDRELQTTQSVYNDLYSIYQRAEALGEQFEVIVGLGCLYWRSPNSGDVLHPVLTLRARLSFDQERGIIELSAETNAPGTKLSLDMLEPSDRPSVQQEQSIELLINQLSDDPWTPGLLERTLKSIANGISPETRYTGTIKRPEHLSTAPQLHLAPALILRKRTRRSFVDFFETILEQLDPEGDVPSCISDFVQIAPDNAQWGREEQPRDNFQVPTDRDTEVYFPLPTNNEQRRIVEIAESQNGILVHGPPGTGKSHTISNLVTHFVARGKRVLVTSETNRALEVLKDKLPKEVEDLCVIWLDAGPHSSDSLERSVKTITENKNHWNPTEAGEKIVSLQQQLTDAREIIARLQHKLVACHEDATYEHANISESYKGTSAEIAKQINTERKQYQWLVDRPDSEDKPEVSSDELGAMFRSDTVMSEATKTELEMRHFPLDDLALPEELNQLTIAEHAALNHFQDTQDSREHSDFETLKNISPENRAVLSHLLHKLVSSMDAIANYNFQWVQTAAKQVAAGQDRVWSQLLDVTQDIAQTMAPQIDSVSQLQVTGLDDREPSEVRLHAQELQSHLRSGKGLGFLGLFRAKVVKQSWYLAKTVRVDGQPCNSVASLQQLIQWLDCQRHLIHLNRLWEQHMPPTSGDFSSQLAGYQDLCTPLHDVMSIHESIQELRELFSELAGLSPPRWQKRDEIMNLCKAIAAVEAESALTEARNPIDHLESQLVTFLEQPTAHPITHALLQAVHGRDPESYRQQYHEISLLTKQALEYSNTCDVRRRFFNSAPMTAAQYDATRCDDKWEPHFVNFEAAWRWATTDRWLEEVCLSDRAKELGQQLNDAQAEELDLLRDLAVERAWQHSLSQLDETKRQALIAWKQAVERIGRGTGRHADRHRRVARQKLAECRDAIPAWVMPLFQVVQTVKCQPGIFDVAIIDEASQSGPEALLLTYIADKVIVVGDDKQIKPDYPGVNRDNVTRLQQAHLGEIPHKENFGLDGSLFSLAELKYPNAVRLREHFRCMPEIIQFSNRLSYETEPLIPLRQFGSDRLEPCKATHVDGGYREGSSSNVVNIPEANKLVETIAQCVEDEKYEGMTFGVITLLGHAQASEIEKLLVQQIGVDEIERRQLRCGRPYDFQGAERDVIFLSMVDAPVDGGMVRMVRDQKTQRQYNVAASRARNQIWLFHSPTLNDLRNECFRYRLLEHCLNPSVEQTSVSGRDLNELRQLAGAARRDTTRAPEPFDSWFEVDVFLMITVRGFRVLPQHEVAGKYIDLVVEGLEGKLAVECHGDRFHGSDRFMADNQRQRQLERCGWRFVIIWASDFYRDADTALAPLWERLEKEQIHPEQKWDEERRNRTESSIAAQGASGADTSTESIRPAENGATDGTPQQPEETVVESNNGLAAAHTEPVHNNAQTRPHTAQVIQQAIIAVLNNRPNKSCTKKSITTHVLRELNINTRGNPRAEFDRRVKRNVTALKHKGLVEEYTATNKRLRLTDG